MSKELLNKIEQLEKELEKELEATKTALLKEESLLKPNTIRGVTSKGEVIILEMNRDGYIDAYEKDLVSVEVGEGVKTLDISNNNLTGFKCNDSLEKLYISNNPSISNITLPEGWRIKDFI